jgi:hypothetical protein
VRQILAELHPVRQIQGDHRVHLDHPVHRGRCAWDAWGGVRPEAAKDASPEDHPVPAAVAVQRWDDCAAALPEPEAARSMSDAVPSAA